MKQNVYDLPDNIADKHLKSIIEHRDAVMRAGLKIGAPVNVLERHDLTKFQEIEFVGYALYFHGDGVASTAYRAKMFTRGLLHHIHNNEHHWQHWLMPYSPMWQQDIEKHVIESTLEMPTEFVLEMIADWIGASYTYSPSRDGDIGAWLKKNAQNIVLHPKTRALLRERLTDLGYSDLLHEIRFYGEH